MEIISIGSNLSVFQILCITYLSHQNLIYFSFIKQYLFCFLFYSTLHYFSHLFPLHSTFSHTQSQKPLNWFHATVMCFWGFPGDSVIKNPPANAGDVGQEDPLEVELITNGQWVHQSCLFNEAFMKNPNRRDSESFWLSEYTEVLREWYTWRGYGSSATLLHTVLRYKPYSWHLFFFLL